MEFNLTGTSEAPESHLREPHTQSTSPAHVILKEQDPCWALENRYVLSPHQGHCSLCGRPPPAFFALSPYFFHNFVMVPSLLELAGPMPNTGLGYTPGHLSSGPREVLGNFCSFHPRAWHHQEEVPGTQMKMRSY